MLDKLTQFIQINIKIHEHIQSQKGKKMGNLTLRELVENAKCREGEYAGSEAGCKFCWPFKPVCIQRNMINDGRDVTTTFSFEIKHFKNGEMKVAVKFRDWMNSKFSREWDVSDILNLTSAEAVAQRLRKGVLNCEDEFGKPMYWVPVDDEGWVYLVEELEALGLPEKNEEHGPNEKIAA
jgi:hypothetical protein